MLYVSLPVSMLDDLPRIYVVLTVSAPAHFVLHLDVSPTASAFRHQERLNLTIIQHSAVVMGKL